jgi:8-oxo-dGTP pyrophosphatase MutT (NUDIX family)
VQRGLLLQNAGALVTFLRTRLTVPSAAAPPEAGVSARAAAVLAPIYAVDGRPYLLFTRRSADLPKHRGEISFPGGARDPADASLSITALREAREEIGLDPMRVEILGTLPPVYVSVSNFIITPQVGWLGDGLPTLAVNAAEVAELIHAPLAALADPSIYHAEVWHHLDTSHLVHFFNFTPYLIWGATGSMLYSLLTLLPADNAS